jgi:uncharacterized protein YjiS (DUF1127 family)
MTMPILLSRPCFRPFTLVTVNVTRQLQLRARQICSLPPVLRKLVLRRALRRLAFMNDHMLQDLGLTRAGLHELWQVHAGPGTRGCSRQRTGLPSCGGRP